MSLNDLSIKVKDRKIQKIYGLNSCVGEIKIGDFCESFIMPLNWWAIEDYEKQWKEGIERIKYHDSSCLVTTVQNLDSDPFIDWWVLYKNNKTIIVYNQILLDELLEKSKYKFENLSLFSIQTCYSYIGPKKLSAKINEKISKWEITF